MTMTLKSILALLMVAVLICFMTACSQSQLTLTLTALTDATSAAAVLLSTLGASGVVPAPLANLLAGALTDVAQATPQIQVELESGDPLDLQISKSVGILTPLLVKDIPGIPANLQGLIVGVNGLITSLIQQLEALRPKAAALGHVGVAQPAHVVMTHGDRSAIKKAVAKSADTVALLNGLKK